MKIRNMKCHRRISEVCLRHVINSKLMIKDRDCGFFDTAASFVSQMHPTRVSNMEYEMPRILILLLFLINHLSFRHYTDCLWEWDSISSLEWVRKMLSTRSNQNFLEDRGVLKERRPAWSSQNEHILNNHRSKSTDVNWPHKAEWSLLQAGLPRAWRSWTKSL
jgi:hypothetical protein